MLIHVVYKDLKYDFVKPFLLDQCLESGTIALFRRKSGWVFVGIDPIRNNNTEIDFDRCRCSDRRQPMRELRNGTW